MSVPVRKLDAVLIDGVTRSGVGVNQKNIEVVKKYMKGINLAEEMALNRTGQRKRILVGYPKIWDGSFIVVIVCHFFLK